MLTLVTGATGLVGNNVVRLLLERGRAVRVLIREGADPRPLAGLPIETFRGDVRDAAAVDGAMQGAESVVHAAAQVHIGWSRAAEARAVNVDGTRHVAAAARAKHARMVHVSSVDALGLPAKNCVADEETLPIGGVLCPYVVTKREAERVVCEEIGRGLDAVIVNPTFMLGPWDWKPSSGRMLLEVAQGRALFAPLGSNNYCDVRDVAAGILAAVERGATGRRYILGGATLTYFQAWRIFAEVTGGRRPRFPAGPLMRNGAGLFGDLCTRVLGREGALNSAATGIAGQCRHFSSERAQQELDYSPRSVAEAATAAWQWFGEYGYA